MLIGANYERRKTAAMWVKINQDGEVYQINLDAVAMVILREDIERATICFTGDAEEEYLTVEGAENVKELERCIEVANNKGGPFVGRNR